jgi:hypothetical protein
MSMRRYIGMMAALLGQAMASNQGAHEVHLFKKQTGDAAIVPYNKAATWHPQSSRIVGAAKQRRASIKQRNINRQKRHPNYRSAS